MVFPAVLVLVLTVLQAGLYWHARDAALSAAQQGLAVAKVSGLSTGESRAASVISSLGGLNQTQVAGVAGNEVSIVVSGVSPSLVPGLTLRVREASAGFSEGYGAP